MAGERDLFRPGEAPDKAYCNLRDAEWCVAWKAFSESLWKRYAPYADRHFLEEIRIQFHPRFWEMYLAVTFLEHGYKLHRHKDAGPEFGIDIDEKRYWFDAIAPTAGAGADAVPDEFQKNRAGTVPQEQIILRYTSALATKREKWQKDLKSGRVSESDGYIVAINDRSIPWAWMGAEMPYIVKALYGLGNIEVVFDRSTLKIIESRHQHRPTIAKVRGTAISSQPFAARESPEVSAVLYGFVNAANYPLQLGENFMILHNDEPNVPLPRGALRFGREYWIEGDSLHMKNWAEAGSASTED
jgi:hypothetical protein